MSNSNDSKRKKYIDFKLRFQVKEDDPEAVMLSYLTSLKSRYSKDLILRFLRMCALPLAYKERDDLTDEQLRIIALESCNDLESHISYIRQLFFLEKPTVPIIMNGQNYTQAQPLPTPDPKSKPEPEPEPEPHRGLQLKGMVDSLEDVDAAFGDI